MIERVNTYTDPDFDKAVLCQHGGYRYHNVPVSFRIISPDTAVVTTDYQGSLEAIIDIFREHAFHITFFITESHQCIKSFPQVERTLIPIDDLLPSQLFVHQEKLKAVQTWIRYENDLILPIQMTQTGMLIADGHTRLYAGYAKGITMAYVYRIDSETYLQDFRMICEQAAVNHIRDLKCVNAETYQKEWIDRCAVYFKTGRFE